ncbi:MAG: hypothetical protein JWM42_2114 [Burkholderia sp.]|jgi:hypothetical protein|nr:hypothetical protein [Burkholderia sp.]
MFGATVLSFSHRASRLSAREERAGATGMSVYCAMVVPTVDDAMHYIMQ